MYLLDTNVVSDGIKPAPNSGLQAWLGAVPSEKLYLSVVSIGEIVKGIERQKNTKRGAALEIWFEQDLRPVFEERILPVTESIMRQWGKIYADAVTRGETPALLDSLLAATAIEHGLIFVTRNTSDVMKLPVTILNPWSPD